MEVTINTPTQFFGAVETPADEKRLLTQYEAIVELMRDGQWRTMQSISDELQKKHNRFFPHGSVGSQLRNARLAGYKVDKRRISIESGLWEYRLTVGETAQVVA